MGGLNSKRCELQGRIEGSLKKFQAQRERFMKIAEKGAVGFASKRRH